MQKFGSLCGKSSFFDLGDLDDPHYNRNQSFSMKYIHSICNIPSFNDFNDVPFRINPRIQQDLFQEDSEQIFKAPLENPQDCDSEIERAEEKSIKSIKSIGSTYLQNGSKSTISVTLSPVSKKGSGCNCKKTGCLKMYCECFSSGKICTEHCSCNNCSNCDLESQVVKKARDVAKMKHRFAFNPLEGSSRKHCNCRKTQCQKKYCECFNSGQACTELCKCEDCRNGTHSPDDCSKSEAQSLLC